VPHPLHPPDFLRLSEVYAKLRTCHCHWVQPSSDHDESERSDTTGGSETPKMKNMTLRAVIKFQVPFIPLMSF